MCPPGPLRAPLDRVDGPPRLSHELRRVWVHSTAPSPAGLRSLTVPPRNPPPAPPRTPPQASLTGRPLLGEPRSRRKGASAEGARRVPGGPVVCQTQGAGTLLFTAKCHCISCGTTLLLPKIPWSYRKRTDEGLNLAEVGGRGGGDGDSGMWWSGLCQKKSWNPMMPG